MGEAVGEIYCDFGNGDLDDQGYQQAEKVRELEKTVNSLKLELRTNQGGTRVWRIRAFAALCVITILPLAVLTIVTLVKEEALEESEEQLENDMNQKFERLEEKMIPKENLTAQLAQLKESNDNLKTEVTRMKKRSAHCGYQNYWSSQSQISYDHLITDDGDSNLDRSSGLWTAGPTGVYQVSWSVQMNVPESRTNRIYLMRDGSRVTESYQNAYNYNTYYSSSYTDEVGGRTMLLSLTKGSTLALRLDNYADPINHIVFCVNLLYVNDNARISVTRVASYEPINGTIHKRDSDIEEDGGLSKE